MMEENEEDEEDDEGYPNFPEYSDTAKGNEDNEAEDQEAPDEPVDDDLGRAIADARIACETEKERLAFDQMIEDHNKLLYPTCEDGHKKLSTTLELLQWKAENGVTDSGFGKLLEIMKRKFPRGNEFPASTYEAKKVVCPLGLYVQKIHACINDCILYRGEYENLDACPVCTSLRYKIRRDDPGDVEGERPRKRVPAKVMWYAPIIPRLKRLFRNKEHARLLRWHKEDRKKDVMLRHPADGSQWRKIDREFPNFAQDARNLRFGLSTDGMNPFGEQSCSHSTWPVTLCIYNLPPWLCMKRKFIMMPVLIQGPKQPGNDIDVYLKPLVEELLQLWSLAGVRVWDEHKQEEFDLRALLFVTINDWPALGNISGQSNKGYNACTHCLHELEGDYLEKCKKVVYLGHRRFLRLTHPVRKKGKHYNGEADHRRKPPHHDGVDIFGMVKDLDVIFGKGPGGRSVPNDDAGHAPMWKKKSIFWDLPYWEVLEVRSSIDVMHVTKNLCVNLLGFLGVYGKTKDTPEAREDQQRRKDPKKLHETDKGRHYSSYALTKAEKEIFFECLISIKVPSGISSNIKGIINMEKKTFQNLKSHDCHVIMTPLLPIALRGLLPENVRAHCEAMCIPQCNFSEGFLNPKPLPEGIAEEPSTIGAVCGNPVGTRSVIGRSNHDTSGLTGNFVSNFIDTVITKPGKPDSRPLQRQRGRNPSTAGIAHFRIDESKRVIITRPFGWSDRIDVFTRALDSPWADGEDNVRRPQQRSDDKDDDQPKHDSGGRRDHHKRRKNRNYDDNNLVAAGQASNRYHHHPHLHRSIKSSRPNLINPTRRSTTTWADEHDP
ncbi:hypothetical protein QYE76_042397 [Lolium multiflorum]|uniref:Uncharacterized protein n=1 Tax=Lolium multiflorum TaxID=4521 RepID=A0AAD8TF56_LOLMU|nr:hypothetical protein QYE76_042397 [Lolium multiflorum]